MSAPHNVNYWDDDWEEQLKGLSTEFEEKIELEAKMTPEEQDALESWEDGIEDDLSEIQLDFPKPPVKEEPKVEEQPKANQTKTEPPVVKSCWQKPQVVLTKDEELEQDFPTREELEQQQVAESARKEKEKRKSRTAVMKEQMKTNRFGVFNEPTKEQIKQVDEPKKQQHKPRPRPNDDRKDLPRPRAPMKSRFCRDGDKCTRGERCHYAHTVAELVPQRCRRGQACWLIKVDYNKQVFNKRTDKCCMYSHDEQVLDYLKRTGQSPPTATIKVPVELATQAQEMARATGGRYNVAY